MASIWDTFNNNSKKPTYNVNVPNVVGSKNNAGSQTPKTGTGKYGFSYKPSGGYSLPAGGTMKDGWYYFSRPKADGGEDYYMASSTDIKSISGANYADAAGMCLLSDLPKAAPKIDGSAGFSAGGGADTSAYDAALADYQRLLGELRPQFEEQYNKSMGDLGTSLATGQGDTQKQFLTTGDTLDQTYGKTLKGIESGMASRGIGDSSYAQNAVADTDRGFSNSMKGLETSKQETLTDLQKQYDDSKAKLETAKYNFNNPQSPKYGSLEEVMGAKSNILGQMDTVRNQKTSLQSSAKQYSPYEFQMQTMGLIDSLGKANVPQSAKDQILKGYIVENKMDPNSYQYLSDLLDANTLIAQDANSYDSVSKDFAAKWR